MAKIDNPNGPIPPWDDLVNHIEDSKLWGNIKRMGEVDPGMRDLLDKVIMYYHLKKPPKNK